MFRYLESKSCVAGRGITYFAGSSFTVLAACLAAAIPSVAYAQSSDQGKEAATAAPLPQVEEGAPDSDTANVASDTAQNISADAPVSPPPVSEENNGEVDIDALSAQDMPSMAPVREDEFNLDMDTMSDINVAWPDMNDTAPDVNLTGALDGTDQGTDSAADNADDETAQTPADDADQGMGLSEDPGGDGAGVNGAAQEGVDAVGTQASAPSPQPMADDGSEHKYEVIINGLDDIETTLFKTRFNTLSMLKTEAGKPANIAQINRRMQSDADLLDQILRAQGYYGAFIRRAVRPPEGNDDKLRVVFTIRPGSIYTLSSINLPGMAYVTARKPELADIFTVKVGDPINADAITAGQQALAKGLTENGFPFASVNEPQVTIDHDTQKGDLELVVRSGGYRLFGDVLLNDEAGNIFSARHLERIARFDRDDVYNASDVEDLRQAIVATGLVSQVSVKPQDAGDGEHANIAVSATPAPMRTVAGEIGYGSGEGYRLEGSWQHRNLFPPEGALSVTALLGTKEQAAGLGLRRNNFRRRDNVLSGNFSFWHRNYDAYKAKTISLSAGIERQSNLLYQKKWSWSIGTELLATREYNYYDGRDYKTNRTFLIGALPMSVKYDSSDDLLDPTKGFRLGASISPEASWQGDPFTYARMQVDGSAYVPMGDRFVIASRVRVGSILGGIDANRIAPSRRFYAGGGASVRGYAYQSIGPRDPSNDPVGGKSLVEFSLEARARFGVFGVVPFIDAGNIAEGFLPELNSVRYGAGIGLRYYSTFGPIRIDVGTPLNRQPGDSRIAVYVSLGQAF